MVHWIVGVLPRGRGREMEIPAGEHLVTQWDRKEQNREGKTEEKKTFQGFSFSNPSRIWNVKSLLTFLFIFHHIFGCFYPSCRGVLQFLIPRPALICSSSLLKVWGNLSVVKGKREWVTLVGWTWKMPFSGWGKPFYFTLSPIPFSPGRAFPSKQRPGDIPGLQLLSPNPSIYPFDWNNIRVWII